jgi:syntaxin 18
MTDLTPILNDLLNSHNARPTSNPSLTLQNIDEFLKEAYRIVSPNAAFALAFLTIHRMLT